MSAGILDQLSIALESIWGTPVTPTKSIAVKPGEGLQIDKAVQFPSALNGVFTKNNNGSFQGAASTRPPMTWTAYPATWGIS